MWFIRVSILGYFLYQILYASIRVFGNKRGLRNAYILMVTAHKSIWILPDVWMYLVDFSRHEERLLPHLSILLDLWTVGGSHIHDIAPHLDKCAHLLPQLLDTIVEDDLLLSVLPRCMRLVKYIGPHIDIVMEHRDTLVNALPKVIDHLDLLEEYIQLCVDDLDILLPALDATIDYLHEVEEYLPDLLQLYSHLPDDKDLKMKIIDNIPQLVIYAPDFCKFKDLLIPHI